VPFLTGSTLGFGLGLWGNWQLLLNRTREYARHYPHILAHALWVENRIRVPDSALLAGVVPRNDSSGGSGGITAAEEDNDSADKVQLQWRDEDVNPMVEWVTQQGLRHLSMCALAAQSCQSDVEEVERQERQRILDATSARMSEKESAGREDGTD
jgi:hypothetical protein